MDFSNVIIDKMKARYKDLPIQWTVMDVRNLSFLDNAFDVAIDKGTLDSFLHGSPWTPPPSVEANVRAYVNEVSFRSIGSKWLDQDLY